MGLLGLFGRSDAALLKKHSARVGNKRAQAPDRLESIHALGRIGTEQAVEALLARFTFVVDPSIVDQEEKDVAFRLIIAAGPDAVPPARRFLRASDATAWGLKCLERLLEPEEVVSELIDVLEAMDVEYERDPQKKIQLLAALEERQDSRIVSATQRFLDDANETARFHAVGAILAQQEAEQARPGLTQLLGTEESLRVKARILDGFSARGWTVGDAVDTVRRNLPTGYALDPKGIPRKS